MLAPGRHRRHRLRHASAGALRVGAGRRQRNRGRLLDPQHPRIVAVSAVEARDLDRVRAALRRDDGDLFVGEAAVVGHVEGRLAERVLGHVGERLGRDRLRPLAELERDVTSGGGLGAGMRRPQRCDRRPVDDEIVVHVQVAEVDRQLLAWRGLDLEVVAVRAARGVAEVERVGLGRLRGPGLAVGRLSRLGDQRGRWIRSADGAVEAGRGDLRRRRLGPQAEAGLRSEAELVARVERQAGDVPGELVLGRATASARRRAFPGRRRAIVEFGTYRAPGGICTPIVLSTGGPPPFEQDGHGVGHRAAVGREVLDREARERQLPPSRRPSSAGRWPADPRASCRAAGP